MDTTHAHPSTSRSSLFDRIRVLTIRVHLGSLPVLVGLAFIGIVFQLANPHFLSPLNLTNLLVQISAVGTMAVGVVLVLLIGEIDLSIGVVSGFCAAVMAVLSVKAGWSAIPAVAAGVLTGTLIGLVQGFWVARLRVPSFVVTLAGLLGWQGALLYVLGTTGTVNLTDPLIIGIANARLPLPLGWLAAVAFAAIFGWTSIREQNHRQRANMPIQPWGLVAGRIALVAVAVLAAVAIMSVNRNPALGASTAATPIRGIPSAVLVFTGFVVFFDYVVRRTRFGRHVLSVGGDVQAARRAGINVNRIRIAVFALSSTLSACGGVLAGSRLLAVNQSSGGGDVLLNAIAAAVIGGTSPFGGRGSTWSAMLGALVIGSIANGMDLLALSSSIKFMVTGVVLLLAVTVDAVSRSGSEAGEAG